MDPRLPEPDRTTVANTAFMLADLSPNAVADGIEMIRQAVFDGLIQRSWAAKDAALFSILFVEAVAEQMEVIASAARTSH